MRNSKMMNSGELVVIFRGHGKKGGEENDT